MVFRKPCFNLFSSFKLAILILFLAPGIVRSQEASLDGATLNIPVLQVGADYYQISLNLVPDTDPIQLALGDAIPISIPSDTSGASIFANNVISIPSLPYEGVSYNLSLPLLTTEPVVFQLGSVGVNETGQDSGDDSDSGAGDGAVVGGGDAWLFDQATCNDWIWKVGSATGNDFTNDSNGNSGVKAEHFEASGCMQSATYHFGTSLIDGLRKLKQIRPPISESQQGESTYAETETYKFTTRIVGSQIVELLHRIDVTNNDPEIPEANDAGETGYAESRVWRYEVNTGSAIPRVNRYEEWGRIINDNDYNELFLISVVEWEYEEDGSVTSATFQEYDADAGEYLEGRYLFSMEGNTLVAEVEATIGADVIPLQKTEYPDLDLFDLTQLPLPEPHGQVATNNSWRPSETFTRYLWDSSAEEFVEYETQTVHSRTSEGYPITVSNTLLNEDTGSMESLGTTYYGYKTDVSGTIYQWVSIDDSPGGKRADIYHFRTELIEIQL